VLPICLQTEKLRLKLNFSDSYDTSNAEGQSMKKLMLDLEALDVESFTTSPSEFASTGTVQGHLSFQCTVYCNTDGWTCNGSCEATCEPQVSCTTCQSHNCVGTDYTCYDNTCNATCQATVCPSVQYTVCDASCPNPCP
jgi:hypothetical protein